MKLEVSDLQIARGGVRVLDGVSFSVQSGEALVLRGPNGIGKTTLLRCLAGLQPLLKGEISVPHDAIAYAAHSDGIKATLTVEENLSFWARVFGNSEIAGALEAFDLGALSNRPAGQLSAGQKRRLGLARLLVTGREIWILDEPTVSLDQTATGQFVKAVEEHLASGGIAVVATHIALGLQSAKDLDLSRFRAKRETLQEFDEAFL